MSSNISLRSLTAADLKILRKVLGDAGYSSDVLTGASVGTAAKLLIGLFQRGMTDPAELSAELEYRFGRSEKTIIPASNAHHQFAIRGLPKRNLPTAH
ncbi:hypothetical protein [Rhizobium sp. 18055]|uniref:hypothetical protein n=1 Tax=Rhizobium sp. 18055 TaxID=2681403 RepID=UPI001357E8AB|nr:hypothetical protein [Rhizobium sp. 18055]